MFRVNDFFCGCGGMGLGFKQAGFETAGAWDYDKFAVQSYAHNVDPVVRQISIMDQKGKDIPKADAWTFGFPCQDLSIAGEQKGMTVKCASCGMEYKLTEDMQSCIMCGSDDYRAASRSGLFFEVMRLLSETPLEDKPSVIMAENVKNLRKHLPVLEEFYKEQGYKTYYALYNSKYWGVPQNRERYFVIGVRDDINIEFKFPTEVKEVTTRLLDILDAEVDEKFYYSDEKAEKIVKQAIDRGFDLSEIYDGVVVVGNRSATGHHGDDVLDSRGLSGTVKARDYKGPVQILEPKISVVGILDINGHDIIKRVYDPTGISATATATAIKGGNQQIKVIMPVPQGTKKGYVVGELGDSINLSYLSEENCSGTRRARVGVGVANTLQTSCTQYTIDPKNFRVRKLTPDEYGRLQGFPIDDGWEQVVSNSQAYKQFGNAVTVNVARVIAEAIIEQILIPHNVFSLLE